MYDLDKMAARRNIYKFQDEKIPPDLIHEYPDSLRDGQVPLIMDNGSYHCRTGWATDDKPRIVFKNLTAKSRHKKDSDLTLVGNDISNLELMKWQLKSQFDRNIVTQYDVQEQILDYTFGHLGINTEGHVAHPIVLTEALCNPNYCRQQMSELLFECYYVPSVTYGVDAMFSLYNNHPKADTVNALLVACGYQTTHIIPVLGGCVQTQHARRMNLGGCQVDSFMLRILQLKYPGHFAHITLARAEELVQQHTFTAIDYEEELQNWLKDDYYEGHVHKMQLPFSQQAHSKEQQLQQQQRKEQQIRRLKEYAAKRREEKLAMEQEKLEELLNVKELLEEDDDLFQKALQSHGFNSFFDLQRAINELNNSIHRTRHKILEAEEELKNPQAAQDEQKRNSKTKKSNRKGKSDIPQDDPDQDINNWLADIKKQRQEILDKRERRKQRKTEMSKRRSHANLQRMKIITQLAQGPKKKKEDTFGQNDEDWNVYKQISKDGGESDSEAEREKLEEFEGILKEYDPEFQKQCNPQALPENYDLAEYYRMHIGIERIRVPELLFQPSMLGIEQAGIVETIDFVLKKFSPEEQNKLVEHVFLTGGCSSFNNMPARIERELLAIRPFQSKFSVHRARDPVLDAWQGARKWACSDQMKLYSVTRADYEEKGGEYLKEFCASNRYYPTPAGNTEQEELT